jgi:SAM-dependent methyltransferase
MEKIFEAVYRGIDGCVLSRMGRNEMNPDDAKYLVYGEAPFEEIIAAFSNPAITDKMDEASVVCDLGSGTGRIAVALALACPNLKKIVGVELVKKLYDASVDVKNRLAKIDKDAARKIELINDNFFNVDFSPKSVDADVIFMHYPMHNAEDMYLKLEAKLAAELKPGTIVISAIRRLVNTDIFLKIGQPRKIQCHYGNATINCYQRA